MTGLEQLAHLRHRPWDEAPDFARVFVARDRSGAHRVQQHNKHQRIEQRHKRLIGGASGAEYVAASDAVGDLQRRHSRWDEPDGKELQPLVPH
jgi:hypothetical protein